MLKSSYSHFYDHSHVLFLNIALLHSVYTIISACFLFGQKEGGQDLTRGRLVKGLSGCLFTRAGAC